MMLMTPLPQTIPPAVQEHIDDLEAKVEAYERLLNVDKVPLIAAAFGCTPAHATIASLLSTGRLLTRDGAYDALYCAHPDSGPEPKIIDVFICRLRKIFAPHGIQIQTIWAVGWRLDDPNGVLARVLAGETIERKAPAPAKVSYPRPRDGSGRKAHLWLQKQAPLCTPFDLNYTALMAHLGKTRQRTNSIVQHLRHAGVVKAIERGTRYRKPVIKLMEKAK